MSDPLDRATSRAPATVGEGCLSRYDPAAMDDETGTEFEDAARLWGELNPSSAEVPETPENGDAADNGGTAENP